jgi:hypothetical protein
MALIIGLKSILGWERLLLFDSYGYVKMIKCLMTKIILFCRLFIGISILFVYGRLFRGWRIETYLWRFMHDWRLRWGILFSNMGGCIVSALDPRLRRYYNCSLWYVILPFFSRLDLNYGCGISVMQRAGVSLNLLSNKSLFIKKIKSLTVKKICQSSKGTYV